MFTSNADSVYSIYYITVFNAFSKVFIGVLLLLENKTVTVYLFIDALPKICGQNANNVHIVARFGKIYRVDF